jgi:hypothetical protein
MFIAASARPKDLAPLGAKRAAEHRTRQESDCAPTERRSKENRETINISPLWGETTNSQNTTLGCCRIYAVQTFLPLISET